MAGRETRRRAAHPVFDKSQRAGGTFSRDEFRDDREGYGRIAATILRV
jgi:hypothetical protein